MEFSRGSVAAIAAACVMAGAGGAYLATRTTPAPAGDEVATTAPVTSGVEQSEGVVEPAAAPAPAPPAVTPPPARAEAVTRPARVAPAPRPAAPAAAPAPRDVTPRSTPPATTEARSDEVPLRPFEAPSLEPSAPPAPEFEELVINANSVIGLQVENTLSSETARVEDPVYARVTRDVRVGDRVAIPAGSRAEGEVTLVERGGKVKERARLGVRFTSIVLADGTRVPLQTDAVIREGDPPGGESAAKIGAGAIGGAILGGILGGGKGAAIGGAIGAGGGTAAVMAGGRNAATLPSGTPVTVRVTTPATVTLEK